MPITKEEYGEISKQLGEEVSTRMKTEVEAAQKSITEKFEEAQKGLINNETFEAFKKDALGPVNELLQKLDTAVKDQGTKVNSLLEKAKPGSKSFEEFLVEKAPEIKELYSKGGYMEFTGKQLKDAGITSIAGAIPTPSPYAPGIGGPDLQIFDLPLNPNYITNKVNLGSTNQSILAWANELPMLGQPDLVTEGNLKPLVEFQFDVELSKAKKAAAYLHLTEEFDQDLPNFSTRVRRMLQDRVIRRWDDLVQQDVIAAARPYNITQLNGLIQDANFWDALLAEMGQVGYYNFTPNTVAINWLTNVLLKTEKDTENRYLLPPFVQDIADLINYANKVAVGYGLVGDLQQYNVDIYKDFVLKVGWINDDLIRNEFVILGEIRYHSYISENRKNAICYDSLNTIDGLINAA
jgi:hypothetical protein